jgi:ABC-type oligopeptide transport system substrate-binding subunit
MGLQFAGSTDEQVQILDGETLKWQTKKALSAYFQQGAEDRPTVLVFEDLHWADPSSLEVLETLLSLIDRVPLLILSLMRPDREHASWHVRIKAETDYPHRYTDIHLQQLMADDASELVSRLLATADLSPALRDKIFSRAEGNPLFLEEILRSLIDRELLVQENGAWRVTEEASVVTIPETLQGVLLARLDRLDEDVRRTLQMASVIGRSFLYRLLAAIGEAEIELDTHLTQLQRVDLVREKTRRPELEYIFKHALTQEAAYNSMLLERRRVFHRQVGEALETLFPDRQDDLLGLLAHHFDCAGDGNKAVEYLLAAGDKARLEDIYDVAIKFYQRAILLLDEVDDVEQSAQTWLKLGLIYHADFKFDEAHAAYETAFALRSEASTKAQDPVPEKLSASSARYFRYSHPIFDFISLDPGQAYNLVEVNLVNEIFAGIAEMDAELNVVPHAARSWEVLDGGRRYLIYLREDVCWTDGTLVTAEDYEWAWKRNLAPSHQGYNNKILDVVVGARDYREGRQDDPDQIGVHARNNFTLEVNLASPVAYFPYLLAHSITFPLRRAVVEQFGDRWWHPENIQSNGAFQLVSFEPGTKAICERNPRYFGDFPGNLERVTWEHIPDARERVDLFRQGKLEHITLIGEPIPSDLPKLNIKNTRLVTHFLVLFPKPPLDNLLVRQALIHALDRDSLSQTIRIIPPRGGLIPPGMPGHTPGLGLSYDPDLARRLLAEAGYPGGEGFPSLSGKRGIIIDEIQMSSQLQEVLGIEVVIESSDGQPILEDTDSLFISGWVADYPDPDSFLRDAFIALMQEQGWRDPEYDALVTQAARSNNRARRMAMYRQADRHLVVEQALVVPLGHGLTQENYLVHPRVRYYPLSSIGSINHRQIIIDPEKSLPS